MNRRRLSPRYLAFSLRGVNLLSRRVTRTVAAIRFIKPEVAVVTVLGSMTGTRTLHLMDVDVMVKQAGTWLIASQHNIMVRDPPTTAPGR